jgi:hypothetical protein
LGPVVKTTHIVFGRHVGARDQAATLLGHARQQLSALLQKALAVVSGCEGGGAKRGHGFILGTSPAGTLM